MNKYQKALKALNDSFYCFKQFGLYQDMLNLKEYVKVGKLTVECIKTNDWRKTEEINFLDQRTTSTYGDCIDIRLNAEEIITVTVWNGKSFDGERTDIRHIFELKGEWWHSEIIRYHLERNLYLKAESIREDREEERHKREREEIVNELLKAVEFNCVEDIK